MIEILLALACLSPNNNSCGKTIEAYGRQSGLEKMIQTYGTEHPDIAFLVGSVGLYKERRLYYEIYGPWFHTIESDNNTMKNTLAFKKDF